MNLVLLSGGSGKRLWPLSNDSRSKQFLKVLTNEYGQQESMIQRVWRQLEKSSLAQNSVIATSILQKDTILSQLNENVEIVVEPERRDTFPAIALTSLYLIESRKLALNEVITVLPVDPFVEDSFFEKIKESEKILKNGQSDLVLLGAEPTYPSEKYGYIVPKNDLSTEQGYFQVSQFREKPVENEARELIRNKAFWNCGVFSFTVEFITKVLKEKNFPLSYNLFLNEYENLPKISFDFEVVEHSENITVIPYQGYWRDLGTWNTLTDQLKQQIIGQGQVSAEEKNTHLINELDIPVAILGLSDVVVAASPDGILVSSKLASPKVKDIISDFSTTPRFEEKKWGWYTVLEKNEWSITLKIHVNANHSFYYLPEKHSEGVWILTKGTGKILNDGFDKEVNAGDVIKLGEAQRLWAPVALDLTAVYFAQEIKFD